MTVCTLLLLTFIYIQILVIHTQGGRVLPDAFHVGSVDIFHSQSKHCSLNVEDKEKNKWKNTNYLPSITCSQSPKKL